MSDLAVRDEIWSFCYAKQKDVPDEHRGTFGYGDVWTWTAICADTKVVPSWLVGERTVADAIVFMDDLRSRLRNRVQLTTDGHRPYLTAVENAFGADIDYAMLHKIYGNAEGRGLAALHALQLRASPQDAHQEQRWLPDYPGHGSWCRESCVEPH